MHKTNLAGGGDPTVVSYLTLAGAPLNQNPGFRSYTFDKSSLDILDYNQYYLDLDKANAAREMKWELEYSAKEYLNLEDLSPTSWNKLHQRFFGRRLRIPKVCPDQLRAVRHVQMCRQLQSGDGMRAVCCHHHKACGVYRGLWVLQR